MIKYALAGSNVSKSFSKQIHEYLLKDNYDLLSFSSEKDFMNFVINNDFKFMNITIPYKETAIKKCHLLSDEAKSTNAINLLIKKDTRLYGYNTDIFGFEYMLQKYGVSVQGKNVLVLGTGATSRSVEYVIKKLGALNIWFLSTTKKGHNIYSYTQLDKVANADIIINTTPIGNFDTKDEMLIGDISKFDRLKVYIDVNYGVFSNAQAKLMSKNGIRTINGLSMLVAQALKSEELFENIKFDLSKYEEMYLRTFKKHFNISLIGHPCSGKTTIGKELADSLEMEFVDVDILVEQKCKMPIKEIIATKGESYFREIEKKTILEISEKSGQVISTGGGAVLDDENMTALKERGIVINLYREVSNINENDLEKRPLSQNMEALIELIQKRKDFYSEYADAEVSNTTVKETVAKIRSLL